MGARANKAIGRLLNQFSDTDNFKALITALAARFEDTDVVLEGLLLMRTIDTAEGVWLDQVGDILGYPRPGTGPLDAEAFTLKSIGGSDDPLLGLSSLGALDGGKLSAKGVPTNTTPVSDSVYRDYLHAKANATASDVTIPAIYTWIKNTFAVESEVRMVSTNYLTVELTTALTGNQRRILEELAPIKGTVTVEIINWP